LLPKEFCHSFRMGLIFKLLYWDMVYMWKAVLI
jgi:hypothetical protein